MFKLIKSTLLVLSGVLAMSSCSTENVVEEPTKMSVTFAAGENGSVDPSGTQTKNAGDTIVSVAKAEPGYLLDGWYDEAEKPVTGGDIVVSGNTLKVKLTAATKGKTYKAEFKALPKLMSVTFIVGEHGEVIPFGMQIGNEGDTITSVANANGGYLLDGWYVDGQKLDSSEDIIISGEELKVILTTETKGKTYKAEFKAVPEKMTITFAASENGSVDPSGPQTKNVGDTIVSVAKAETGYLLDGWYVDGKRLVPSEDIIISGEELKVKLTTETKDKTYKAEFVPKEITITFAASENGSVDPSGPQTKNVGDTIVSVAKAETGYLFDGWYVDGKKLDPSDDIIISDEELKVILTARTKDKTYQAEFKALPKQMSVTFAAGTNGTVDPSGQQTKYEGDTIVSVAKANGDYALDGWYVDGEKLVPSEDIIISGNTLKVKLTAATKDKTYQAEFKALPKQMSVTFAAGENGSVDPSGLQTKYEGDTIVSVAKANGDYRLDGWYDGDVKLVTGGDIVVSGNTLKVKLTAATDGKSYTANFQPMIYTVAFVSEDTSLGTVNGNGGSDVSGTTYTSTATALNNYQFAGWYDGSTLVESEATLSKTVSSEENGKTYTARFYPTKSKFSFTLDIPGGNYYLPISSIGKTGDYGLYIHWGDKSEPQYLAPGTSLDYGISHFYKNSIEDCVITITSTETDYRNVQMPKVRFGSNCLVKAINTPLLNTGVTSFESTFSRCASLTSLPAGFFKYNAEATNFKSTFFECTSLKEIPADLFKYNTEVITFYQTFRDCTSLEALPADLFKHNTKVTTFSGTFGRCRALKALPADLFRYNTEVTDFSDVFNTCEALASLPFGLFSCNTKVKKFHHVFESCTYLMSIPVDLFKYNTEVTSFEGIFSKCWRLPSIPKDLFRNNRAVTNFSYAFLNCSALGVNPHIFCDDNDENEKATRFNLITTPINFEKAFYRVGWDLQAGRESLVRDRLPDLWNYGYSSAGVIKTGCFESTYASNSEDVPDDWK
ncbi:MAG: InlB B-repeat-containing protein [Phocaeicola sp.]